MERDNSTQFLMNSVIGLTAEQSGERRQYSSCVCSHQVYEWRRGEKRETLGPEGSLAPSAGGARGEAAGQERSGAAAGCQAAQAWLPEGAPSAARPAQRFCGKLSEKNLSHATCPARPALECPQGAHPAQTNRGGGLGRAQRRRAVLFGSF